jgi:predicted porin
MAANMTNRFLHPHLAACTLRPLAMASALLAIGIGSAHAQNSTLQLYGRVDVNVTKLTDGPYEVTQTSTSRIGLRGTENIGGGLSAIFQLESRINPDTGTTESKFWGRESWVGLRGGFGTVRLGRSLTPSQRIASNYDPHGTDGIGSFGSGGLMLGHSVLARFDDGGYYETPRMGGFSVFAAVQADDQVNAVDDRYHSVRLRYEQGPVDLSLGYADLSPGNKVTSIGGSFKLGMLTPMFQVHTGQRNNLDRRHWLVGSFVKMPVGEIRAAYSKQDDQSAADIDRTLLAVGYDHPLSRRTMLYGTVVRDATVKQAARRGFEAGIRHLF